MKPMERMGWAVFACLLTVPAWSAIILPENVDWSTPPGWYLDEEAEQLPIPPVDLTSNARAPKVRVLLRPPAATPTDSVTLSDIADIVCVDADLRRSVASIDLGAPPQPGDSLFIFPNRIEASLRKLGLSTGDFEILGPERISLSGESQLVAMADIEEAINAALSARALSGQGGIVQAHLARKVPPIHLPPGELEIEAVDLDRPGGGVRNIQLAFHVDGRKVDARTFSVRVDHQSHALVASRPIEEGEVLGPADLTEGLIPVSTDMDFSDLVFDPERLLGNRVSRAIAQGEPIAEGDLIREPLRARGGRVNLVHRVGKVQTTAPGELLEDALEIGQPVRVKKTNSRKTFVGKVLSPWEVEVH